MAANRINGVYGPGSYTDQSFVPVPQDCHRILRELAAKTPGFTADENLLGGVNFVGSDLPLLPGCIKSQAVTSCLHAMAGIIGHEILRLRGIASSGKTIVNTDQGGMYPATPALVDIDGVYGTSLLSNPHLPKYDQGIISSPVRMRSQAIYPTKTPGVWYQLHGSTNPEPVLEAIGVDPQSTIATGDLAYEHIKEKVKQFSARDLEGLMMERGLAGGIIYSPKGWLETMMGKTLARKPLVNYKQVQFTEKLPPVPFPTLTENPDARPLAGIKVLEICRIIAAPAAGAVLASMGAEVIRIQTKRLGDFTPAQLTLMAGKRNLHIELQDMEDKKKMESLMAGADVIIQGYRLNSLERRGVGQSLALALAAARQRGVVFLDENCYGADGYYAERPGWQQVADAAAGSEYVLGKAYGYEEGTGILPSLPISDMSTGILSAVIILSMLRDRATMGGSWWGNASLTRFNMVTMEEWVGLYPPAVVARIQDKFQYKPMGPDIHVVELYYQIVDAWNAHAKKTGELTADESFYVHFKDSVYGQDLRILAPIVQYPEDPASAFQWTSPPRPFCSSNTAEWGATD